MGWWIDWTKAKGVVATLDSKDFEKSTIRKMKRRLYRLYRFEMMSQSVNKVKCQAAKADTTESNR